MNRSKNSITYWTNHSIIDTIHYLARVPSYHLLLLNNPSPIQLIYSSFINNNIKYHFLKFQDLSKNPYISNNLYNLIIILISKKSNLLISNFIPNILSIKVRSNFEIPF